MVNFEIAFATFLESNASKARVISHTMRFAIDALCHAIAFIVDEFSVVARGDLFAVACFCTVSRASTRT